MIRYPIWRWDLRRLVEEEKPGWFERAAERTAHFEAIGKYEESSTIWGEIKAVYMRLQHHKCAYCERRLAGADFGSIEHDLEHYRPKNEVPTWPTEQIARERQIEYDFSTGEPFPEGYYLLAYSIFNYAAACKPCNSPLKSNYFPIARKRGEQSRNPRDLRSEHPFLLYPVGRLDEDPEELLTFDGLIPVPIGKWGHKRKRAVVTIDFFELDTREELLIGRAERIRDLYTTLELMRSRIAPQIQQLASKALKTQLSPASAHTNCARAFHGLYRRDQGRAKSIAELAVTYLEGQS